MPRKRIPVGIRIQSGRNGDFARNRILEYSPHDWQFMVMEGSQRCAGRSGSRVPRGAGECC